MRDYARRYGLSGTNAAVCLAVADIRHQGRAKSADILAALDGGDSLERLLCLGEGAYPERIATLRTILNDATQGGGFGDRAYDEDTGEFV
jgi:hypothetical protein